MKTSRLKHTVIAVLALLNAFLLVLLFSRRAQERAVRERTAAQLVQLFASSGVELPPSLIPTREARLSVVEPARDLNAEAAFAAALLGECTQEDVGGGIYRYVSASGQCLLRASGAVEAELDREVGDPEAYCRSLFRENGYAEASFSIDGGSGTAAAVRTLSDAMVFNAGLTLTFSENRLLSVTGSFVPPVEADAFGETMDGVTALVRFLDYSNSVGEVCTAISGVRCGYLLQSTASASQRLIPAWCVETDVNYYYVNSITGEITREA